MDDTTKRALEALEAFRKAQDERKAELDAMDAKAREDAAKTTEALAKRPSIFEHSEPTVASVFGKRPRRRK